MDTQDIPKPLLDNYAKAYVENWVVFGGGYHQYYCFVPRTIKATVRGTKSVWGVNLQKADSTDWLSSRAAAIELRQQAHGDPGRYAKYLLTKVQWEVDCAGQRVRAIQIVDYDEDGNVIWSAHVAGKLEEPVPDSNGEGLLRAFCNAKHQITFRDLVNTPMGVPVSAGN